MKGLGKRVLIAHLRQTALNAGYNNGLETERRDRQRGAYYDINSQREFQRVSKD